MAQSTAGASHALTARNDGGTVMYGGNIGTGAPVTVATSLEQLGFRSGMYGSKVVESNTANIGSYKPYSGGTFAYKMVAGQYIGMRMPGYISGVADTRLETGAGDFGNRHSVHRTEGDYQMGLWSNTTWDYVTGVLTKGTDDGEAFTYKNIRGSGNVDDATRSVPGELVYNEGKGKDVAATQADYPAKND